MDLTITYYSDYIARIITVNNSNTVFDTKINVSFPTDSAVCYTTSETVNMRNPGPNTWQTALLIPYDAATELFLSTHRRESTCCRQPIDVYTQERVNRHIVDPLVHLVRDDHIYPLVAEVGFCCMNPFVSL